jgi:adenine-specific DNA-methyltransferase
LKDGPWPKFYFTKNGKGGIRRKTYLSAVGDVPPTNLFEYKDVGHTDEAKKEILKLFDGKSPFSTPKPERLVKRILQIATDPGDLVLDSFLGSGTTAAVAHKMGRRWIGVELGDHAKTHCAVRMRKVIEGEQGGISKAVGWKGGGSFRFLELGEEIFDADGAVRSEVPWDVLAAHIWFTETKTPWNFANVGMLPVTSSNSQLENGSIGIGNTSTLATLNKSPVLGVYDGVAYALLYNGVLRDRRVDGGNVLTRRTLALIREDLGATGNRDVAASVEKLVVFAEWSRLGPETLAAERIEFRQTPYDLKGAR